MVKKFLGSIICSLSVALASAVAEDAPALKTEFWKRAINQTELDACREIQSLDPALDDVLFVPNTTNSAHYMITSSQGSTCVYTPRDVDDLAAAIKIVGKRRVRFAISCSGHASNPGFSSTPGVHISLKSFQHVTVSPDNAHVDIGGGLAWSDVFDKLDRTTINVVGGRVPGPGVGGMITGGGGYSWITNQYGLTGDTLISVDMVLPNGTLARASETENPDLFWAVKGGGNGFGVVHSFRLRAFPKPPQVYGDIKLLASSDVGSDAFMAAVADFAANNKDPKAQMIPLSNYVLGVPLNILIAYYDGIPAAGVDPFRMFNQTLKNQTFNSFIKSLDITNVQYGQRGGFNTVSLERYSPAVLAQIANQTAHWGGLSTANSATFLSYQIEPFVNYSQYARDSAWYHGNHPQLLNLFFSWTDPTKDAFWRNAQLESARIIKDVARAEGQKVDELLLYPNYAAVGNPVKDIYGCNVGRIEELRRKYDPEDVMFLTTFYRFG